RRADLRRWVRRSRPGAAGTSTEPGRRWLVRGPDGRHDQRDAVRRAARWPDAAARPGIRAARRGPAQPDGAATGHLRPADAARLAGSAAATADVEPRARA